MASGDAVVQVLKVMPPGASAATMDARPGGSTPAENVRVLDFDAASDEYMDWLCKLEGYEGGGLTFTLPYMMSSAIADDVVLAIAVRRLDAAEDVDTSHTYSFQSTTATVPGTSGFPAYPTIALTHGAQMDNWAEGELAIVRVMRDADNVADDAAGDLELLGISAEEGVT